jgi:hypothetical protein
MEAGDTDVLEFVQTHHQSCAGPHADSIIMDAVTDQVLRITPEDAEGLVAHFTVEAQRIYNDPERRMFDFFTALFRAARDYPPQTCFEYLQLFFRFFEGLSDRSVWISDAATVIFQLFHGRWDFCRELQRWILEHIFQPGLFPPAEGEDFDQTDAAVMTTLVCRFAQSLRPIGYTPCILEGFAALQSAIMEKMQDSPCLAKLLMSEIHLTGFICNQNELDTQVIADMMHQELIPSEYHRRLILAAVAKFQGPGQGLNELANTLFSQSFAAESLLLELEDVPSFDEFDSPPLDL